MLIYPHLNPYVLKIGPIKIAWYGIMYLLGFMAAWFLGNLRVKRSQGVWNKEQLADLIFYAAIGVILGGRIGYMLFYNFPGLMANPVSFFKIWQGGMSFHGGLLGVGVSVLLFARRYQKHWADVIDFMVPLVPIGLGFGRLGNFINAELVGRITTVPWGMVFPNAGPIPRHPSQIYEMLLEGVLLFTIVWCFSAKPRPRYAVLGLFLSCYGLFRTFAECFRQPDPQYGFIAWNWLTMGQILSFPMILLGCFLLLYSYRNKGN